MVANTDDMATMISGTMHWMTAARLTYW